MQKCALYFGSFNPLHYGHLAIAEYVMRHCDIDRFVMVLSPHNPFKKVEDLEEPGKRYKSLQREIAKFNERFAAGRAKDGKCNKLEISDIEFHLSEPLYTINTLHELQKQEPDTEFLLVVGSDSFNSLPRWHRGVEILKEFRVIVYPRKGSDVRAMAEKYNAIYLENAPLNNISSTEIRNGLADNGL